MPVWGSEQSKNTKSYNLKISVSSSLQNFKEESLCGFVLSILLWGNTFIKQILQKIKNISSTFGELEIKV